MFGDARLPDRFWGKVIPEPNSGCWLWLGAMSAGRCMFRHEKRTEYVHRVAYKALVGKPDKDIKRTCGVDECCNPAHFRPENNWSDEYRKAYKLEWNRTASTTREDYRAARLAANRRLYAKDPSKSKSATMAWRAENHERTKEIQRESWHRHRDRNVAKGREERLKRVYGLTVSDLEAMIARHNNSCAICLREFGAGAAKMHIDHCHETGAIRGLLCVRCNIGLGNFRDNPDHLVSAIAYLASSKKGES